MQSWIIRRYPNSGYVTTHFKLSEFACHDGMPYPAKWIDTRLKLVCRALEVIRAGIKGPLNVLSGYRTPKWNAKVGGEINSQHLQGRAADITSSEYPAEKLAAIIEQLIESGRIPQGGLGIYPKQNFVHYDIRGAKSRWKGR